MTFFLLNSVISQYSQNFKYLLSVPLKTIIWNKKKKSGTPGGTENENPWIRDSIGI